MAFAIKSHHFHLGLRTRPDNANGWCDEEVARRWWARFPKRKTRKRTAAEPTQQELDAIVADGARVAELRSRLGSVSWLMRCLREHCPAGQRTRRSHRPVLRGPIQERAARQRSGRIGLHGVRGFESRPSPPWQKHPRPASSRRSMNASVRLGRPLTRRPPRPPRLLRPPRPMLMPTRTAVSHANRRVVCRVNRIAG